MQILLPAWRRVKEWRMRSTSGVNKLIRNFSFSDQTPSSPSCLFRIHQPTSRPPTNDATCAKYIKLHAAPLYMVDADGMCYHPSTCSRGLGRDLGFSISPIYFKSFQSLRCFFTALFLAPSGWVDECVARRKNYSLQSVLLVDYIIVQ